MKFTEHTLDRLRIHHPDAQFDHLTHYFDASIEIPREIAASVTSAPRRASGNDRFYLCRTRQGWGVFVVVAQGDAVVTYLRMSGKSLQWLIEHYPSEHNTPPNHHFPPQEHKSILDRFTEAVLGRFTLAKTVHYVGAWKGEEMGKCQQNTVRVAYLCGDREEAHPCLEHAVVIRTKRDKFTMYMEPVVGGRARRLIVMHTNDPETDTEAVLPLKAIPPVYEPKERKVCKGATGWTAEAIAEMFG